MWRNNSWPEDVCQMALVNNCYRNQVFIFCDPAGAFNGTVLDVTTFHYRAAEEIIVGRFRNAIRAIRQS